ncbi:MAG: AI-2E family transporter [Burkholderiales bacterium]|nr:AI-2E family transporter [Burkholderiales bacterium]
MHGDRLFPLLVAIVTLAFALILWPFYGAVFWATVLAIVFAPLYRRIELAMRGRASSAALTTLFAIVVIVILPAAILSAILLQQGFGLYERVQAGEFDLGRYLRRMMEALPGWAASALEMAGLDNLGAVQDKLAAGFTKGVQFFASQALNIGQNTLEFVVSFFIMLYLLFFLLRDGRRLSARIKNAIPLREDLLRHLSERFTTVIRATVKGNIVVAALQGALGGLVFWFLGIPAALLWGVVMAFLSLLPAVGTALVWGPVAIYFLVTGETWQGIGLALYGVLVIGLVDNVVRPMLVGKDTKLPDYVVLISTLGGIAIFGLNGFVIGPVIAALFIAVWDTVAAAKADPAGGAPRVQ